MKGVDSRYPLEAARTLRAEAQDACARALAEARRAHEDAAHAREEAERAQRDHHVDTERVAAEERVLDAGGRSLAAMLRAQDWLARRAREEHELARRVSAARELEVAAEAAVERARDALATARAELEAVEKHRAAWLDARRRAAEKKEEDEADERGS